MNLLSQVRRNGSESNNIGGLNRSQMQVIGESQDTVIDDIMNQYNDIIQNPPSSPHNVRIPSHPTPLVDDFKIESDLSKQYPIIVIKESELFKNNQNSKNKPDTLKKPKQVGKKQVPQVASKNPQTASKAPLKSPKSPKSPVNKSNVKKPVKVVKKTKKKPVQRTEEEQNSMKELDQILQGNVSEQDVRIFSQRQKYKPVEEIKEQPDDQQDQYFSLKFGDRIPQHTLDHQSDDKTQIHSPATDNRIFMSQHVTPVDTSRQDKRIGQMKIVSSKNQSSQQENSSPYQLDNSPPADNQNFANQIIEGSRSHITKNRQEVRIFNQTSAVKRTPDTTPRNILSSNRGLLDQESNLNRGARVLDQIYDVLSDHSRSHSRKSALSKSAASKSRSHKKSPRRRKSSQVKIPKRANRLKQLDEIQPKTEQKLPIIDIDTSQMNSEGQHDTSEFYRDQPHKRVSFVRISPRQENKISQNSKTIKSTKSLSESLSMTSQTLETKSLESNQQNVILSKPMKAIGKRLPPKKQITNMFSKNKNKDISQVFKQKQESKNLHFPIRKKNARILSIDKLEVSPLAEGISRNEQMTFKISNFNKRNSVKKMLIYHKLDEERKANVSMHEDLKLEPVFYAMNSEKFQQSTNKQKKLYMVQSQLFGMDLVTAQRDRLIYTLDQARLSEFEKIQSSFIFKKIDSFTTKRLKRRQSSQELKPGEKPDSGSSSDDEKVMEKWQKSTDTHKRGIKSCEACLNSLVIRRSSAWKGVFDILMLFVSCYNIFSNAYYSAFGIPTSLNFMISDNVIEGLFWIDMIFNFCTEYLDEESFKVVDDFRSIFMHYIKGTFLVDFIACLPLSLFIGAVNSKTQGIESEQIRLFRLIKFLRLPRLAELLNVQRFQSLVVSFYDKQLIENINRGQYDKPFPILRAQLILVVFKMSQLVIIIFSCSFFLGIIWLICVRDIQDWQNLSLYDVYSQYSSFILTEDFGFEIDLSKQEVISQQSYESLIKLWYYGLTTLSTIGYGDFLPKSVNEKILISFVMLGGNSIFSYITGKFIKILFGYKELEQYGDQGNLNKWMALMQKVSTNESNMLQKDLMLQIQDYFNYFWIENPHSAFRSASGQGFLNSLTVTTVQQIYLDFLFNEFFYAYGSYFRYQKFGRLVAMHNFKFRSFLVKLVQAFEPRMYSESYGIIQEQFHEVYEILYVFKGSLLIGYRLFNDLFFAKHYNQEQMIVGDFSTLNNKVSEYLYRSFEEIHGFAIKKQKFINIFKDPIGRRIKPQINSKYINEIRVPVNKHRSMMSKKFAQRIDYVDLAAFGVGVISDDKDYFAEGSKDIEKTILKYSSSYGRLIQRLKRIDKHFKFYEYELAALAKRYDERMQQQVIKEKFDKYQIELLEKMFNTNEYLLKQDMIKQMKIITKVNLKVDSSKTLFQMISPDLLKRNNLKSNDDLMNHVEKIKNRDKSPISKFLELQLKLDESKLFQDQNYKMKQEKLMKQQSDQLSKLSEQDSVSMSSNSQEVFKNSPAFRSPPEKSSSSKVKKEMVEKMRTGSFGPQALKLMIEKEKQKQSQKKLQSPILRQSIDFVKQILTDGTAGSRNNPRVSQGDIPKNISQYKIEDGSSNDSP